MGKGLKGTRLASAHLSLTRERGDISLKLSYFCDVLIDVGNLIPAFSKSSLNIWKFMVHVLLDPGLDNFERYFATCEKSGNVS